MPASAGDSLSLRCVTRTNRVLLMDLLLGLDLGTTNCKALIVDTKGQPVAHATTRTPCRSVSASGPGASSRLDVPEYDAEALWHTGARLIREALANLPPDQHVAAIAVCSMAEAGVLIDDRGDPLASILTWYDQRTMPFVEWWHARISDKRIFNITGLPPDHTYSAHKLLWHREQAPQAFSRARTWLCLADWITYCLTGERTTSHSMASRTMLFDVQSRCWSQELLDVADLPPSLMPPAFPSGQVVGYVTPRAASLTGLQPWTPVVTGGHDHMCGALAAGSVEPGTVVDSAGTAEAMLVVLDTLTLDETTAGSTLCFGCHTVPDRYYLLGGVMGGGVVSWVSRVLTGDDSPDSVNRLMGEAAASPLGANNLWFLPYLEGKGPPAQTPEAWGAWLGLRLGHSRADLVRAAMEGLSFRIRHMYEDMVAVAGYRASELRAVGGGTRNTWWQQLKANAMGMSIETPALSDVGAQGTALLAGMGVGVFANAAEAAAVAYCSAERYSVDEVEFHLYDRKYHDYLRLCREMATMSLLP